MASGYLGLPRRSEAEARLMPLTLAIRRASAADAAWQAKLNSLHVDRYAPEAKGAAGTELRGLYEAKLAADRLMAEAFGSAR